MKAYQRFKADNIIAGLALCAVGFTVAYFMQDSTPKAKKRSEFAIPPAATVAHTTSMPDGELLRIQVPSDPTGLGIIEVQTCWVWRDAKMATASISCPSQPTYSTE